MIRFTTSSMGNFNEKSAYELSLIEARYKCSNLYIKCYNLCSLALPILDVTRPVNNAQAHLIGLSSQSNTTTHSSGHPFPIPGPDNYPNSGPFGPHKLFHLAHAIQFTFRYSPSLQTLTLVTYLRFGQKKGLKPIPPAMVA
jgi:hypothetical protein